MVYNDWNNDYLAHHGIKGMHWGIRRFQNPDGTLTSAGKERYKGEDTLKEKNELVNRQKDLNRKAKTLNRQITKENRKAVSAEKRGKTYSDEKRKALSDELDSVMADSEDVLSKLDDFKEKQANKTLGQKVADLWVSEELYGGYKPRDYMMVAGALAARGAYKIAVDKIWDKDHSKRDAMTESIDNTVNSGKQWMKTNVTDPIKNSAYAKRQGVTKEDTMYYLTDQFKKGKISEEEFRAQGKSMGLNKRMIENGLETANSQKNKRNE